ncbi:MAG: YceI family protein [Ignavibacteriaceae bacterium]
MDDLKEVQTQTWSVDKAHSKMVFAARHMVISEVQGQFDSYDIRISQTGDKVEDKNIEVEIDVNSINTGNPDRDNHLKSTDFFESEKYPKIIFKSKSIKKIDDENYKLTGDFTIKNITKELELDVSYGGQIADPWGNNRAGFAVRGSINRFDFDLKWNNLIETGGAVVGKTIKLICDIELVQPNNQ